MLFGCKSSKHLAEVEETNINFIMPELKSTLNIHYDLNRQSLKDTFNKVIDYYLVQDMELTALGMDVLVSKNEEADIDLSGRRVLTQLPIKINVSKNTILNRLSAEGILQLNFITEVDIDSSWNFLTKTTLEHFEWTQEPALSLGVFSIPVGSLANGIIEKSKSQFEQQIDKSVNDQLSIRDKVLELLKYVEQPIKLDTILDSWVSFIPEYVHMAEITNYQDVFNGNITVQGRTKITEGKPDDIIPGIRLPEFNWHKELDDTSHINFVFDIKYDNIESYLRSNYIGKTFTQDGKNITLNSIDLYKKGKKLVVESNVSGSINGDILITGTPIFDNTKQSFYADDIDIQLKTKNMLHKAGAWLLKGKIKNQLSKLLAFSIEDNMESIQRQLDQQIDNYSIKNQLSLAADIRQLQVSKFVLDDQKIHSFTTINLFLKASIHDMSLFGNSKTLPLKN